MQEHTARAVLRLLAVVSMLVGVILTSSTAIMLTAMNDMIGVAGLSVEGGSGDSIEQFGLYTLITYAMPLVWGAALYYAAPKLARHVAE